MTIRQIRARLNTLKRKYALPLLILRLRRPVEKFCDDWAIAQDQQQPLPETHLQVNQFAKTAPRLPSYMDLQQYINRVKRQKKCPNPSNLFRHLFPQAHETGLLARLL